MRKKKFCKGCESLVNVIQGLKKKEGLFEELGVYLWRTDYSSKDYDPETADHPVKWTGGIRGMDDSSNRDWSTSEVAGKLLVAMGYHLEGVTKKFNGELKNKEDANNRLVALDKLLKLTHPNEVEFRLEILQEMKELADQLYPPSGKETVTVEQDDIDIPDEVEEEEENPRIVLCRPELAVFAAMMEKRLKEKDAERGETGWKGMSVEKLAGKLAKHADEFSDALYVEQNSERIAEEAIDIANYAMMIYDAVSREG